MAYNSAYTGSQVDAAVGAVRQKETIWDGKQDELTGTEDQLVGFNSAGKATAVPKPTASDVGAMPAVSGGTAGQVLTKTEEGQEWQDAPDGLPSGGEEGQVLTKTASGAQWDDIPSDLPAGGTDGQILTKTADGVAWEDAPEGGVTSFNSRTGAITPQEGDYTAAMVGALPTQTGTQGQVLGFTADNTVGAMDAPSGLPDGGTTGQMLYQGASGPEWGDKPIFQVTITSNEENGTTADKTVQDIKQAVQSGYIVVAVLSKENVFATIPLYMVSDDAAIFVDVTPILSDLSDITQQEGYNINQTILLSNGNIISDNFVINRPLESGYFLPIVRTSGIVNYINAEELLSQITESTSATVTLTASGWTGSSAPYSQQVSCSIVAADTAVVAVDVDTPGTDADADAEAINAWALCTQRNPTQGAGTLTFYCTEKPTINIPVKVGVA